MTFDDNFDDLANLAYRVAFRLLGSRQDAEEVAQDALVRAYLHWRAVEAHARPWVSRVSSNLAIGVLRKRRPDRPDERTLIDEFSAAVDRLELQQLLLGLPRRQREVVTLRYLADLSEAEIARELGCSPGSVKRHAHRGLGALRTALGPRLTEVP